MNYELPVAKDITILVASGHQKSAKSTLDEMKSFDKTMDKFFHFYGGRFEINNHLISTCIGCWQEQRLTGQQKRFTAEQKKFVFSFIPFIFSYA